MPQMIKRENTQINTIHGVGGSVPRKVLEESDYGAAVWHVFIQVAIRRFQYQRVLSSIVPYGHCRTPLRNFRLVSSVGEFKKLSQPHCPAPYITFIGVFSRLHAQGHTFLNLYNVDGNQI